MFWFRNLNILIYLSQIFLLRFSYVNDMTYVNQLKAHYWNISWQAHIHCEMNSYFCVHTGSWQIWEEINGVEDNVLQEKFMKLLKKSTFYFPWNEVISVTFFDFNGADPHVRLGIAKMFAVDLGHWNLNTSRNAHRFSICTNGRVIKLRHSYFEAPLMPFKACHLPILDM